MKYKPNSDWNHAWGAAPANIIPRYLWGIQPKTPGFKVVQIKPQMGKLKKSTIKIPTIKGSIEGDFEFVNERLQKYRIVLPANVFAEFSLKLTSQNVVTLNGKELNLNFGSIRLEPGLNEIEIKVNSY
jgi:hypothetical protein